jgi:mono/diheme cytochrome c family protein
MTFQLQGDTTEAGVSIVSASSSRFRHSSKREAIAAAAFVSLLLAAPAWSFPWDIDMYRGATVQPLATAPRVMPEGTLPATGAELPMSRDEMTSNERNPLSSTATPEDLAQGKDLFATDCAPCHGDSGRGDGSVAHLLRTKPSDLISGASKDRSDGYIYGTIRDGGTAMPSLGDAMSEHERWQVVMFVRSLQRAAVANK